MTPTMGDITNKFSTKNEISKTDLQEVLTAESKEDEEEYDEDDQEEYNRQITVKYTHNVPGYKEA